MGGGKVRLNSPDLFSLCIGKRVLKSQVSETGIPIYSANVHEPFGRIEDAIFDDYSVGTIIWGIDGDWDVNYIPPETPFYPTDHCGTIRVLTPDINPHYLAFALKAEGKRQRFTRANRASTNRIRSLQLILPSKENQDKFIEQVDEMDVKIIKLQACLSELTEKKQVILEKYL